MFALRIVMPFVRTASGSCGSASFTAFCTSTAARSWLREMSKVTAMFVVPSLEFVDA